MYLSGLTPHLSLSKSPVMLDFKIHDVRPRASSPHISLQVETFGDISPFSVNKESTERITLDICFVASVVAFPSKAADITEMIVCVTVPLPHERAQAQSVIVLLRLNIVTTPGCAMKCQSTRQQLDFLDIPRRYTAMIWTSCRGLLLL